MNRKEVYDILVSIDDVLSGDYAPQEKLDAVRGAVDSFTGAWIESTTYESVLALAKQKVSTGKMMQVKTLVKLCGVDRLEELRDDATKMAAFHDFLKIL
jgi:hypothetical protein